MEATIKLHSEYRATKPAQLPPDSISRRTPLAVQLTPHVHQESPAITVRLVAISFEETLGLERRAPLNARKPAVVAISGHPLAPRLDSQRGEPSILDQVAGGSCVLAQLNEDRPMAVAWLHKEAGVRFHEGLAERDRVLGPARLNVNARMSADANHRGECLWCNTIRGVGADDVLQPAVIVGVARRILTKRVQQDVHVRKNHSRPSNKSSNAAESSKLTPGRVPPLACETGRRTRFTGPRREGRASTRRRPRSMRAVRVSPRRDASSLALAINPGSSRTVVRICLSISFVTYVCQLPVAG